MRVLIGGVDATAQVKRVRFSTGMNEIGAADLLVSDHGAVVPALRDEVIIGDEATVLVDEIPDMYLYTVENFQTLTTGDINTQSGPVGDWAVSGDGTGEVVAGDNGYELEVTIDDGTDVQVDVELTHDATIEPLNQTLLTFQFKFSSTTFVPVYVIITDATGWIIKCGFPPNGAIGIETRGGGGSITPPVVFSADTWYTGVISTSTTYAYFKIYNGDTLMRSMSGPFKTTWDTGWIATSIRLGDSTGSTVVSPITVSFDTMVFTDPTPLRTVSTSLGYWNEWTTDPDAFFYPTIRTDGDAWAGLYADEAEILPEWTFTTPRSSIIAGDYISWTHEHLTGAEFSYLIGDIDLTVAGNAISYRYYMDDFSNLAESASIRDTVTALGTWNAWTEQAGCSFTRYIDGDGRSWGRLVDANAAAGISPYIQFFTSHTWVAGSWFEFVYNRDAGGSQYRPDIRWYRGGTIVLSIEFQANGIIPRDNATRRTITGTTDGTAWRVRMAYASDTTYTITITNDATNVQLDEKTYTNRGGATFSGGAITAWMVTGSTNTFAQQFTDIRASWLGAGGSTASIAIPASTETDITVAFPSATTFILTAGSTTSDTQQHGETELTTFGLQSVDGTAYFKDLSLSWETETNNWWKGTVRRVAKRYAEWDVICSDPLSILDRVPVITPAVFDNDVVAAMSKNRVTITTQTPTYEMRDRPVVISNNKDETDYDDDSGATSSLKASGAPTLYGMTESSGDYEDTQTAGSPDPTYHKLAGSIGNYAYRTAAYTLTAAAPINGKMTKAELRIEGVAAYFAYLTGTSTGLYVDLWNYETEDWERVWTYGPAMLILAGSSPPMPGRVTITDNPSRFFNTTREEAKIRFTVYNQNTLLSDLYVDYIRLCCTIDNAPYEPVHGSVGSFNAGSKYLYITHPHNIEDLINTGDVVTFAKFTDEVLGEIAQIATTPAVVETKSRVLALDTRGRPWSDTLAMITSLEGASWWYDPNNGFTYKASLTKRYWLERLPVVLTSPVSDINKWTSSDDTACVVNVDTTNCFGKEIQINQTDEIEWVVKEISGALDEVSFSFVTAEITDAGKTPGYYLIFGVETWRGQIFHFTVDDSMQVQLSGTGDVLATLTHLKQTQFKITWDGEKVYLYAWETGTDGLALLAEATATRPDGGDYPVYLRWETRYLCGAGSGRRIGIANIEHITLKDDTATVVTLQPGLQEMEEATSSKAVVIRGRKVLDQDDEETILTLSDDGNPDSDQITYITDVETKTRAELWWKAKAFLEENGVDAIGWNAVPLDEGPFNVGDLISVDGNEDYIRGISYEYDATERVDKWVLKVGHTSSGVQRSREKDRVTARDIRKLEVV